MILVYFHRGSHTSRRATHVMCKWGTLQEGNYTYPNFNCVYFLEGETPAPFCIYPPSCMYNLPAHMKLEEQKWLEGGSHTSIFNGATWGAFWLQDLSGTQGRQNGSC